MFLIYCRLVLVVGDALLKDTDACSAAPCGKNGTCTLSDNTNGYTCTCGAHKFGTNCENGIT